MLKEKFLFHKKILCLYLRQKEDRVNFYVMVALSVLTFANKNQPSSSKSTPVAPSPASTSKGVSKSTKPPMAVIEEDSESEESDESRAVNFSHNSRSKVLDDAIKNPGKYRYFRMNEDRKSGGPLWSEYNFQLAG